MGEGLSNVESDLFESMQGGGQGNESTERAESEDVTQHMFRCEVRDVLRMAHRSGSDRSDSYLFKVEAQRGSESAERLRAAAKDQWIKGNRGEADKWL